LRGDDLDAAQTGLHRQPRAASLTWLCGAGPGGGTNAGACFGGGANVGACFGGGANAGACHGVPRTGMLTFCPPARRRVVTLQWRGQPKRFCHAAFLDEP
jgi:hypothetical protein